MLKAGKVIITKKTEGRLNGLGLDVKLNLLQRLLWSSNVFYVLCCFCHMRTMPTELPL